MEKDRTDPWKLHLLELDKRFTPCDLDWNRSIACSTNSRRKPTKGLAGDN